MEEKKDIAENMDIQDIEEYITVREKEKRRLLDIFFQAVKGQGIQLEEIMREYGISSRTFRRDKELINAFLADNLAMNGGESLELKYNRKYNEYRMDTDYLLADEELVALVKILIGSRALSYKDMSRIISKLSRFTTQEDRALLRKLLGKEKELYCEIHADCDNLLKNHWQLTKCIQRGREVTIRYLKMDRSEIRRRVKPLSITFSDYYFYLIAVEAGKDEAVPKYYRIDRITKIKEHNDVQILKSAQKDPAGKFDEEQLRKKSLLMWPGPERTINFEFTGPSLQAVLDKLPTATYREENGKYIVEAQTYGDGIKMFLLSQGSWVRVLGPESFVSEMEQEIERMKNLYSSQAPGKE